MEHTFKEPASLSHAAKLFLFVQFLFALGTAFSSIFMNLFLWKLNQSLHMLEILYLIQSIIILVSFPLCSIVARKIGHLLCWQLGVLLYLVGYVFILVFQGQTIHYYGWLGVITGLAMGLNATGMHIFNIDTTMDTHRDKFLNYGGILNAITGMVGPAVSGIIIANFAGIHGYYIVFSMSTALYLVAILVSVKIPRIPIHGQSHIREVLFNASKPWRRFMNATYAWGAVDGIYTSFLVTILAFLILKSERWVGLFITGQSIVGLLASIVFSRTMNHTNRQKFYLVGSLSLFASSLLLAVFPLFSVFCLQTLVAGAAQPAFGTPFGSRMYEVIEQDPNYEKKRLDYIVVREIPLGIGRALGLVLFMLCNEIWGGKTFMLITLVILTSVYVFVYPVMKNSGAKKKMDERHESQLYQIH